MPELKTVLARDQGSAVLESRISKNGLFTACVMTLLLWSLHVIWFMHDTRPPVWDMALHQSYALNYVGAAPEMGDALKLWERSGNYPPFVHIIIAALFLILHPGPHIAALANLPASLILFWAIFNLAKDAAGPAAGRWTCVLAALTPYLIWMSRETILDYWLSAWFAAALVLLKKTQGFKSGPWSILLGVVLGLGMLTKWFLAALILIPLLYIFVNSRTWKFPARCVHFLDCLIIAGLIAAPWYLPNIPRLVPYFKENAAIGAREGEPAVFSFQSLIYYVRLLEGYQLFAILFMFFLVAAIVCWRKRLTKDWTFLVVSIAGPWLLMTLLRTKDPRFTMPVLGLLAIFGGAWIQSWNKTVLANLSKAALLAALCLQAYAANFGISWLPERVILLRGYQGSLRWDWNLYLQNYFGILGQPKKEDWKHDEILRTIAEDSKTRTVQPALAVIPDMPWFSEGTIALYSRMRNVPLRIHHLQSAPDGLNSFAGFNYVLMTEREQGMAWTTVNSRALNEIVMAYHQIFRLIKVYGLPNGDAVRLYYVDRKAE